MLSYLSTSKFVDFADKSVKEISVVAYYYYGAIEGFEPEPGISYRLRIKEFEVANPPADGSSKRWVLDMIVESAVVDAQ